MNAIELAFERWKQDPSTVDDLMRRLTPIVRGWAGQQLSTAKQDWVEDAAQLALTDIWSKLPICDGRIMGLSKVLTRYACQSLFTRFKYKNRDFTQLIDDYYEPAPAPRHREYQMPDLNATEQLICDQFKLGFTQREIAEALNMKLFTVRSVVNDVRRKCGINVPEPKRKAKVEITDPTKPRRKPRMDKYQPAYDRYLAQPDTINDLLSEWTPIIRNAVRLKLPSTMRVDKDDVTQVVLCEVWKNMKRCRGPVRPWVLSIVKNRCLDHIRKLSKSQGNEQQPDESKPERMTAQTRNVITMPTNLSTVEHAITEQLADGATVREIAEELSVPRSTVQRQIEKLRIKFAA